MRLVPCPYDFPTRSYWRTVAILRVRLAQNHVINHARLSPHRMPVSVNLKMQLVPRRYDFPTRSYRRAASRLMSAAATMSRGGVKMAARVYNVSTRGAADSLQRTARRPCAGNFGGVSSAKKRRTNTRQTPFFSALGAARVRVDGACSCHDTVMCVCAEEVARN